MKTKERDNEGKCFKQTCSGDPLFDKFMLKHGYFEDEKINTTLLGYKNLNGLATGKNNYLPKEKSKAALSVKNEKYFSMLYSVKQNLDVYEMRMLSFQDREANEMMTGYRMLNSKSLKGNLTYIKKENYKNNQGGMDL